jgi:serine/threonine-protein kinase
MTDFGIAKALGETSELTRTGMVVGSPAYLSPEQVQGLPLDGRSDLFSLGVVLFELLLRRKPFAAETFTSLVYQILTADPLAAGADLDTLPPELADLRPGAGEDRGTGCRTATVRAGARSRAGSRAG